MRRCGDGAAWEGEAMRVLVTGAGGFVGASAVRTLAEADPAVRIVAADAAAPDGAAAAHWAPVADRVETAALDVRDRAAVRALVEASAPTHVVHLAAVTPSPEEERADPLRVLDVNLGGAFNVLDAATSRPGVRRVPCFGSTAIFGGARSLPDPIEEETPAAPAVLYGMTKAALETIVPRFGQLRGVETACLRLAAVYGPLERPTGSRTSARMSQIRRLVEALAARRPVSVHGPDALRDWTHGDDVAGAIAALVLANRMSHGVYNVSCGVPVGWHGVQAAFAARGLEIAQAPTAEAADVAMSAAEGRPPMSIARIADDAGWRPRYPRFEDGLDATLAALGIG
jgi:nucleoside-diphosphate-sugar epimerase